MWTLPQGFLTDSALCVAVVGVGGTGSEVVTKLTRLHFALKALGYGGLHVVAFDPDTVSPANIVRQNYAPADIGRNKADVLINRINMACGLSWRSIPARFTCDASREPWDIVISCVDSRSARAQIHKFAFAKRFSTWKLWIDTGNTRHTGQVILGTPRPQGNARKHHLPCATELHPELRDTTLPDDNAPSCSALEAIRQQDLFVNSEVALKTVQLLWQLFTEKHIDYHGIYFNVETGSYARLPVPAKPKPERRRKAA